jgi:hypothetical protein
MNAVDVSIKDEDLSTERVQFSEAQVIVLKGGKGKPEPRRRRRRRRLTALTVQPVLFFLGFSSLFPFFTFPENTSHSDNQCHSTIRLFQLHPSLCFSLFLSVFDGFVRF